MHIKQPTLFLLFLALALLRRPFLFGRLLRFERVRDAQVAARGGQQRQALRVRLVLGNGQPALYNGDGTRNFVSRKIALDAIDLRQREGPSCHVAKCMESTGHCRAPRSLDLSGCSLRQN